MIFCQEHSWQNVHISYTKRLFGSTIYRKWALMFVRTLYTAHGKTGAEGFCAH